MSLEFVKNIPGGRAGRGRTPYAAREIQEFLSHDGERYAHVVIEGREPKNMNQSFRNYLKRNPDVAEKVAVHLIGGELYLERLD